MTLLQPHVPSRDTRDNDPLAGTAIRLQRVSKCYHIYDRPRDRLKQALFGRRRKFAREFWALRDLDLEIHRGETLGIIGRNGSGKSTLLQIICGILTPTAGHVKTNGRVAALLELGAGFHPEFTGRENVHLNASILGLSRSEIDARFDRIAAFADIGDFLDQPVKTYSSGMFVRLAFSVIAHVDADILVIDEALAVGDAFFTQKCMRFLRAFRERGTLCFVSHDAAAVLSLCQRALWLDAGRMRLTGPAKAVSEAYLAATLGEANQSRAAETSAQRPDAQRSDAQKRDAQRSDEQRRDRQGAFELSEMHSPPEERSLTVASLISKHAATEVPVTPLPQSADAFGEGGAQILGVDVCDNAGQPLQVAEPGIAVTVRIHFRANVSLFQPIVGFYLKDRLGQNLFGQNTQCAYGDAPPPMAAGEHRLACFTFEMPQLQPGAYTLAAAVADGTTDNHTQHHWVHDACILTAAPPRGPGGAAGGIAAGLVGIPMKQVEFRAVPLETETRPSGSVVDRAPDAEITLPYGRVSDGQIGLPRDPDRGPA